jgi:hypothetical protein
VEKEQTREQTTATGSGRRERVRKERIRAIFRVALPSFYATARNDPVVGTHFGRADQGPKNGPAHGESIGRADSGGVTEGEAAHLGWVTAHPAHARRRVRAVKDFFDIARSGRRTDLLAVLGRGGG